MSKVISVPGQGDVEFPDEMSDEQITAAIKRTQLSPMQKRMGLGKQGDTMGDIHRARSNLVQEAGGRVTDATGSPLLGAAVNVATDVATDPLTYAGGFAGKAIAPAAQALSKRVMQSALKPTWQDLRTGKAAQAIDTMLSDGFNADMGGVNAMKGKIAELNDQVAELIKASPAKIQMSSVLSRLKDTLNQFTNQVSWKKDAASIRNAWDEFVDHPAFAELGKTEKELEAKIAAKESSKAAVLQDAGRFATHSAQQEVMSSGGNIGPHLGGTGMPSPSSVPVMGMPRVSSRITENADRIPEANAAWHDALVIARQRETEKRFLEYQLDALRKTEGSGIPVQTAQELKTGTYRALGNKSYGELKGAEVEAQKALARGLKEEISSAVPEVAPLNAKESKLINAANIAERRAMLQDNNNLGGLVWMAHDPAAALGFMADKSALVKSLLARFLHKNGAAMPAEGAAVGGGIGKLLEQQGQQ